MVQDAAVHEPVYALPANDAELNRQLIASRPAGQYAMLLTGANLELRTASGAARAGAGRAAGRGEVHAVLCDTGGEFVSDVF